MNLWIQMSIMHVANNETDLAHGQNINVLGFVYSFPYEMRIMCKQRMSYICFTQIVNLLDSNDIIHVGNNECKSRVSCIYCTYKISLKRILNLGINYLPQ